jgi:cytochrome c-type biogenesis protein CcmH/NrfG
VEDDTNYEEGHLNLGLILAQQNRKSDAENEFEKAVALAPKDPATLTTVGKAEVKMGKVAEGTGFLRKVVDVAPDAANLFQMTVELQPRNAMAWYLLGQSLEKMSETSKALTAWRKAIEIDPKLAQALISLARALQSTDQAVSEKLMARYLAVQKERRILDRADTLANNGIRARLAFSDPADEGSNCRVR